MKIILRLLTPFALCAVLLFSGCATKLESGGAYAPTVTYTNAVGEVTVTAVSEPDYAFFVADSLYVLAYETFTTATDIEQNNRALLWKISPDIKHTLDQMRPQASEVKKRWDAARAEYKKNPTPAGLGTLEQISQAMSRLASSATAAIQQ